MRQNKFGKAKAVIPVPTTVNKEGFPAYERSPEEQVLQTLMTGTPTDLFYMGKDENIEHQISVLSKFEDIDFLIKAILYARDKGYTRVAPILGEVVLSTKDLDAFKSSVHSVCKNPKDWKNFIDICRSKKVREGLGRAIKRELIEAIRNMEEYHAIKYTSDVYDMINVSRPNESVNPAVIKYAKKGEILEAHNQIALLDKLNHAETIEEAVWCVEQGLPFEAVTSSAGKFANDVRLWEALLYVAPHFNLIRNLNTFSRHKVFKEWKNVAYAVKKITDLKEIETAKLFPFRYFAAYQAVTDVHSKYTRYADEILTYSPKSDIPDALVDALKTAAKLSVLNVPEMNERLAIMSDVSGSMKSPVTDTASAMRCIDVVGLFSAMLSEKNKGTTYLIPFNDKINLDMIQTFKRGRDLFEKADALYPYGGTSLSIGLDYLTEEGVVVDKIVAFTDNEEWVGRGCISSLENYKRKVNPNVKTYFVTLIDYGHAPVPQHYQNTYFVYGWSDNVLRLVTSDLKTQVSEVRNYVPRTGYGVKKGSRSDF